MDLDEHDLAGIDLENLEQAYHKKELYTIPQISFTKFIRFSSTPQWAQLLDPTLGLGIQHIQQREQHKPQKDEKKQGRKSTQKLIQEIITSW
jgi:hypothetical protein